MHTSSRFSDVISQSDRGELALKPVPSADDQQILEAFVLLVALRLWTDRWRGQRVSLAVRSDNMAALTLVAKMQPHGSPTLGRIAREMALDVAASECSPDVVAHIPGISNAAADILFRRFQPGKVVALPGYLGPELQHAPEPRPRVWWRSRPAAP